MPRSVFRLLPTVHLPSFAGGEVIVALAVDEHEKHRPARVALTARAEGDVSVPEELKNYPARSRAGKQSRLAQ